MKTDHTLSGSGLMEKPATPEDGECIQPQPAMDWQGLLDTLRHARVFIASRERMNPIGIKLYDETITNLQAGIAGAKGGHHADA